ncbi:BlaI/MecI/CopY family transcriptional regulator [Lachnospiraceae bacterium ZAX-1]
MKMKDLTPSETIVMKCIWDSDHEMSLSEILNLANGQHQKNWKSQTVSTFLTKLVQKDYLRLKRDGKIYTYEVLITEEAYKNKQAHEFVSFWNNGSVGQFLSTFYVNKNIEKEELEEIKKIIDELDK